MLLQDWVTIRGTNGPVASIAQGAESWVDVGDYEDLVFLLEVREISPAGALPQIAYETSPNKHESSFRPMVGPFTPPVPPAATQRVDRVLASYVSIPAARFVRWRITTTNTNTYDITFRILMSAYAWVKA